MAEQVIHYFGNQGWRGWRNEVETDWANCTAIVCLQKKKRPVGWYDVIWGFCCFGSYIVCGFVGKLYYNDLCYDSDDVKHVNNCKNVSDGIYWVFVVVIGVTLLPALGISRVYTPRLRCKFEGSSRFYGLIGTLFELTTVGLLGAFLHVQHQNFCWLFVILGVFDMCAMKLLVPNYDFKGPAVFAQVAISTSLFPGVRKWSFTPWVICTSFGIYVLKTLIDTNWRVVVPETWFQCLNTYAGVFAEAGLFAEADDAENDEENVVINDGA